MPETIDRAIRGKESIVFMFGSNRSYAIGDIAYRVTRERFASGMLKTKARFARAVPVIYVDGRWAESKMSKPLIVNWSREITLLESDSFKS